jgi:hypothetical protein
LYGINRSQGKSGSARDATAIGGTGARAVVLLVLGLRRQRGDGRVVLLDEAELGRAAG